MVWIFCSIATLVWYANLNFNFLLKWYEQGQLPKEEKLFNETEPIKKGIVNEEKTYSDTLFEKDNIDFIRPPVSPAMPLQNLGLEIMNIEERLPQTTKTEIEEKQSSHIKIFSEEKNTTELTIVPKTEEKLITNIEEIQQKNLENLEPYDPKRFI